MKKYFFILVVGLVAYGFIQHVSKFISVGTFNNAEVSASDNALDQVFKDKQSNIQVEGSGEVIKILPDDTQGSRHQKFIVKLKSGQTLLIVHNIDIAPRINDLNIGDHIEFYGEYEWNAKGGVVHWTHHDPGTRHEGGWINHGGRTYQ